MKAAKPVPVFDSAGSGARASVCRFVAQLFFAVRSSPAWRADEKVRDAWRPPFSDCAARAAAALIALGANLPAAQERALSTEEALQRLAYAYGAAAEPHPAHWMMASRRRGARPREHRMTESAIHILSRFGDKDAVGRLEFAARSGDPFIRRAYVVARTLQGDVDTMLAHMLDEDEVGRALVEFERVHDFFDALVNLGDGTYDLRSRRAAGAINSIGGVLLTGNDPAKDETRKADLAKLIDRADWRDPLRPHADSRAIDRARRRIPRAREKPTSCLARS